MDHKAVEEYILSMPNSWLDYPFGKEVAVYKVDINTSNSSLHRAGMQGRQGLKSEPYKNTVNDEGRQANEADRSKQRQGSGSADSSGAAVQREGKMFALIAEDKSPVNLSLKCDPELSKVLREKYETVMPGYHLNKKHWNTIILSGQLSPEEIQDLIRHSYNLVTES